MFKYKGMSLEAAQLRKRARNLPPLITKVIPANNTTIPVYQTFTVTFNKYIKPGSAYNDIILWNNDLNMLKPSTITINGNKLTITPTTKLMNAKYYSLIIPANSITDLAGNNLQNTYNSTYKTDGIPPTITSINPTNGTTTNNTTQTITVTFNEQIKAGTTYNTITVKNSAGTTQSINKTINGTQLIITPTTNYPNDTYTVNIPINSITDLAGNPLQNPLNSTFTVNAV